MGYKDQFINDTAEQNTKTALKRSYSGYQNQPGYRAEGISSGTATPAMPSVQGQTPYGQAPAQAARPQPNPNGLRHYRGSDGQVISTYDDTLPTNNMHEWVTWNPSSGGNDPENPTGEWRSMVEGDKDFLKRETREEKNARLLKEKNASFAKEFREGLPGMENAMLGQLGQQTASGLSENIKGIREGAASRGLLYSGARLGAEAGARNKAGGMLARGSQAIKESLRKQADSLDNQAIQSGIDIQKSQQQIADNAYSQALAEMNADNAMMGSLFSAAGMAAGMYFAPGMGASKGLLLA